MPLSTRARAGSCAALSPCTHVSEEASDGAGEAACGCFATRSRYWQAKSRLAVLMGSPFEIASAYCKATDAAGVRPLDCFFEDAASAGVLVNKRHVATSTVKTEPGRA